MRHGYAMGLRCQAALFRVLRMEPLAGVDAEDLGNFAQPVHAHDALAFFVKANHLICGMDFSRQFVAGYAERACSQKQGNERIKKRRREKRKNPPHDGLIKILWYDFSQNRA